MKHAKLAFHYYECDIFHRVSPKILSTSIRAVLRVLLDRKELQQMGITTGITLNKPLIAGNSTEKLRTAGGKRWEEQMKLAQDAMEYSGTKESFDTVLDMFCSVSEIMTAQHTSDLASAPTQRNPATDAEPRNYRHRAAPLSIQYSA
jgi:hypothetical protein